MVDPFPDGSVDLENGEILLAGKCAEDEAPLLLGLSGVSPDGNGTIAVAYLTLYDAARIITLLQSLVNNQTMEQDNG